MDARLMSLYMGMPHTGGSLFAFPSAVDVVLFWLLKLLDRYLRLDFEQSV